jgi:predicted nucleic acid-binding protein
LVVDSSVVLSWYFPDEASETTEAARRQLARQGARVPTLWWFEIRNALVIGERRARISPAQTAAILGHINALPIRIDRAPDSDALLTLARAYRLTVYDAAYLELALRADAPLATLDRELARAVRAARVPLLGEGNLR